MAAALWVLGDTEDEVEAERIRLGLQGVGRVLAMPGRARFMQRVEAGDATVNDATPADLSGRGRPVG